jgi:pSer/pThr/pTyr-binding forkhead associated (FHA) protein
VRASTALLTGVGVEEAADRTLQLLPGRLAYANDRQGEDIRFVRSGPGARFTFGRSPGPAATHIQLRAPTVSRKHAYMAFEAGHWVIGNLSRTNSVVVNDVPLDMGTERVLEDGDRIEMGEVALVFHAR